MEEEDEGGASVFSERMRRGRDGVRRATRPGGAKERGVGGGVNRQRGAEEERGGGRGGVGWRRRRRRRRRRRVLGRTLNSHRS